MANEITASGVLLVNNGIVADGVELFSIRAAQSGKRVSKIAQNVGTSEETLDFGDIASPGWYLIKNLDPTNYVQIGPATTVYQDKLLPGTFTMGYLSSSTLYAKANTAACNVLIFVLEV